MIAFVRGRLDGPADTDEVSIRTDAGRLVVRMYAPPGDLSPGDAIIAARATVPIGVVDEERAAMLGRWAAGSPDPAGPLGLASTPVILLPDPSLETVATSGADRAGRGPEMARLPASTPGLGLELLVATSLGAEVIVLNEAEGRHVDLVRILGGRAVVALAFHDAASADRWFAAAELDADIPIPTAAAGWPREVSTLGLESNHQLVQVDPTAALDETAAGDDISTPIRGAAAAGILAGRIAAGNRRWRAALEP